MRAESTHRRREDAPKPHYYVIISEYHCYLLNPLLIQEGNRHAHNVSIGTKYDMNALVETGHHGRPSFLDSETHARVSKFIPQPGLRSIRCARVAHALVVRSLSQLGNHRFRVREARCNSADEWGCVAVGKVTELAQLLKEQGTVALTQ